MLSLKKYILKTKPDQIINTIFSLNTSSEYFAFCSEVFEDGLAQQLNYDKFNEHMSQCISNIKGLCIANDFGQNIWFKGIKRVSELIATRAKISKGSLRASMSMDELIAAHTRELQEMQITEARATLHVPEPPPLRPWTRTFVTAGTTIHDGFIENPTTGRDAAETLARELIDDMQEAPRPVLRNRPNRG